MAANCCSCSHLSFDNSRNMSNGSEMHMRGKFFFYQIPVGLPNHPNKCNQCIVENGLGACSCGRLNIITRFVWGWETEKKVLKEEVPFLMHRKWHLMKILFEKQLVTLLLNIPILSDRTISLICKPVIKKTIVKYNISRFIGIQCVGLRIDNLPQWYIFSDDYLGYLLLIRGMIHIKLKQSISACE